jgi:histone H2A
MHIAQQAQHINAPIDIISVGLKLTC